MNIINAGGPSDKSWVAAIHRTQDDFIPIGSAVVIDAKRALTSAHVVKELAVSGNAIDLWLAFPMVSHASYIREKIVQISFPHHSELADVAILFLEQSIPTEVNAAPLLCPQGSTLVGRRWWAFGFAGGSPQGHSTHGVIGDDLGYEWIRLDTDSRYKVSPGFSGSGLWSPDYEAVVGVLGQANEAGDGLAITLFGIDKCLPDESLLKLTNWSAARAGSSALASWGWSLTTDVEAHRHWRPRARGVTNDSERGHRFRGRKKALSAVVGWLERSSIDRKALLVTGSPGAGKSAVLGRIVTTADYALRALLPADDDGVKASPELISCAVHAKGKTALEVAEEVARAASAQIPLTVADLALSIRQALSERQRGERFNVIIDALDEAVNSEQAREILKYIVLPLVETCSDIGVQVVLGSRRVDDGGDIVRYLGAAVEVVDLDDPIFFDIADLASFALATLQLVGDERTDNPYNEYSVAAVVADRIAQLSAGNFLIAGLMARSHGLHDRRAVQLSDLSFSPTVDSALHSYLDRVNPIQGVNAKELLSTLALAKAPGLTSELWSIVLEAITGKKVPAVDLVAFAKSSAASFLVESSEHDGNIAVTYRLFHQALNDVLLNGRKEVTEGNQDELAMTQALLRYGCARRWTGVPGYLTRSLPDHAASVELMDLLLSDPEYILHADLIRLIQWADKATSPLARSRARMIQLTPRALGESPGVRAAQLSVTEALEATGTTFAEIDLPMPYRATWASARPQEERFIFHGHNEAVNGICMFILQDRVLLATCSDDCTIRIWDPSTGQAERVLSGHTDRVHGICSFVFDGQPLLASSSDDCTVRIWSPMNGQMVKYLPNPHGNVHAIHSFVLEGKPYLVGISDDRTSIIWDIGEGCVWNSLHGVIEDIYDMCVTEISNRPLLAVVSADRKVHVWDPQSEKVKFALPQEESRDKGMARMARSVWSFAHEGKAMLSVVYEDGSMQVWDAAAKRVLAESVNIERFLEKLCLFAAGKELLLAVASGRSVQIMDAYTGRITHRLPGHTKSIRDAVSFTLNGKPLLATASIDRTVRVWDPGDYKTQDYVVDVWNPRSGAIEAEERGHTDLVNSVIPLIFESEGYVISASADYSLRVWGVSDGLVQKIIRTPFFAVRSLCLAGSDSRPVVICGREDGRIMAIDLVAGSVLWSFLGHERGVNCLLPVTAMGTVALASGSDDETVRLWRPESPPQILYGHVDRVNSICSFSLGRDPYLASASSDGTIRLWNARTSNSDSVLTGHNGGVNSICMTIIKDRNYLISSSDDHTVRLWDLLAARTDTRLEGHAARVNAVCVGVYHGLVLAASASDDATVRIWDVARAESLISIPVHHAALDIAWADGKLVVALSAGILTIAISPDWLRRS
ncbi:hypothetical protein [Nonomuraea sp. NPDC048826]|uniref:hypothetical protein n=1 Tax=Nonomuraea sp. NPDC048826 TaxID=3364347 RepID=UPI00371222E2